jgi:hypothetical protein
VSPFWSPLVSPFWSPAAAASPCATTRRAAPDSVSPSRNTTGSGVLARAGCGLPTPLVRALEEEIVRPLPRDAHAGGERPLEGRGGVSPPGGRGGRLSCRRRGTRTSRDTPPPRSKPCALERGRGRALQPLLLHVLLTATAASLITVEKERRKSEGGVREEGGEREGRWPGSCGRGRGIVSCAHEGKGLCRRGRDGGQARRESRSGFGKWFDAHSVACVSLKVKWYSLHQRKNTTIACVPLKVVLV